jgi:hypothetical protein
VTQAEEWITLSAAIGMDVEQSTPYGSITFTPEAVIGSAFEDTLSWSRLEDICPGDLIEV